MNIKNREAVIEKLAEMLKQFDMDRNQYQTDVYAYYNKETEEVTLDTFTNVGGNSWLDDYHTTIYTDKEHHDGISDHFQSIQEFADALDMSVEEITAKTAEYREIDIEDVDYYEVQIYVDEEHIEKLTEVFNDYYLDDVPYVELAEEIISRYEDEV